MHDFMHCTGDTCLDNCLNDQGAGGWGVYLDRHTFVYLWPWARFLSSIAQLCAWVGFCLICKVTLNKSKWIYMQNLRDLNGTKTG